MKSPVLNRVTVSRYEPSNSALTIHSSVVRFADADPLKLRCFRDASPDTRALVLSRNTQKSPRVVVGLGHDRPAPSAREPRPDPAPQAGPDLDVVGHRGVDDVVEKADPQDLSEPLARLVVSVGAALRIRVADAPIRELLETDEVQGCRDGRRRCLGRDQHVHLGVVRSRT